MTQDIARTGPDQAPAVRTAAHISQATAVEQARAVAEVAAAVKVAQEVPRDLRRAWADMEDACRRESLANRAFYDVKNRGTGPTVHLAKELARIFGNIQYGVHELRRDDDRGESEIQAYAWDVERNTRQTRTFISPHVRMKSGKRQPLIDIQDIYLSNQNVGARAVRECILTILPADYVDEAQRIARDTLENGGDVPLEQRITAMVDAFANGGITREQLEARIGRASGQWTAQDVASMGVLFESLRRGETTKEEEFPAKRVTVDEITGARRNPQTDDGAGSRAETSGVEGVGGSSPQDTTAPSSQADIDPDEDWARAVESSSDG